MLIIWHHIASAECRQAYRAAIYYVLANVGTYIEATIHHRNNIIIGI